MNLRPENTAEPWNTRQCPFCAETIKREAKVCPRCRQWLTLRSIRNPAVSIWVFGVPHLAIYALFGVLFLTTLNRFENPKPDYTEHQGALQVNEPSMVWAEARGATQIFITGFLTNQSEIAWREIELECRFFDPAGRLLDAGHPRLGLTIQGHDDAAFRATVSPVRPTNSYASFTVSVSTARNTKGLF